jgi:hypothetical protein
MTCIVIGYVADCQGLSKCDLWTLLLSLMSNVASFCSAVLGKELRGK